MAQPLPKHRAREYETIFIVHPESSSDIIDQIAGKVTDVIGRLDGKLLRAENWGKRRLAYSVKKQSQGLYMYLRYLGYSDLVHEIERNFRMLEPVIKYLTVKIDEDVNPEARPVNDADISFVPMFEEEEPEKNVSMEDTKHRYDSDDNGVDQDDEMGDEALDTMSEEVSGTTATASEEEAKEPEPSAETAEPEPSAETAEPEAEPVDEAAEAAEGADAVEATPNDDQSESADTAPAPEGDESDAPEKTDEKED
jgi:small subunit ribosomal protein S6